MPGAVEVAVRNSPHVPARTGGAKQPLPAQAAAADGGGDPSSDAAEGAASEQVQGGGGGEGGRGGIGFTQPTSRFSYLQKSLSECRVLDAAPEYSAKY